MNRAEYTLAARRILMDHLIEKGYPNLTHQQMLNELKPIWIKLEDAKLAIPGKFKQFCDVARTRIIEGTLASEYGVDMSAFFVRRPS